MSRMIPPNVAVISDDTTHSVGANPRFAAACTPIQVKALKPKASVKKTVILFFSNQRQYCELNRNDYDIHRSDSF